MTKLVSLWRVAQWAVPVFALVAMGIAMPAQARVYVGFGYGGPVWGGYYYPPQAYGYYPYGYAPGYYYPPAAQPVPGQPMPSQQGGASTSNCRDYTSTQTIDGQPTAVTGTACQQSDGSWRIVQ